MSGKDLMRFAQLNGAHLNALKGYAGDNNKGWWLELRAKAKFLEDARLIAENPVDCGRWTVAYDFPFGIGRITATGDNKMDATQKVYGRARAMFNVPQANNNSVYAKPLEPIQSPAALLATRDVEIHKLRAEVAKTKDDSVRATENQNMQLTAYMNEITRLRSKAVQQQNKIDEQVLTIASHAEDMQKVQAYASWTHERMVQAEDKLNNIETLNKSSDALWSSTIPFDQGVAIFDRWRCCNCRMINPFDTCVCERCDTDVKGHFSSKIKFIQLDDGTSAWVIYFGNLKQEKARPKTPTKIKEKEKPKNNQKVVQFKPARPKTPVLAKKTTHIVNHIKHEPIHVKHETMHAVKKHKHGGIKDVKHHEQMVARHVANGLTPSSAKVADAIGTITLPGDAIPLRFANMFADSATDVKALTQSYPIKMARTGASQTNYQMAANTTMVVTTRSDARHSIVYDANPDAAQFGCRWLFAPQGNRLANAISAPTYMVNLSFASNLNDRIDFPLVFSWATAHPNFAFKPHGDFLPAGRIRGESDTFFWIDGKRGFTHGSTLNFEITSTANVDNGQFCIHKYNDNGVQRNYDRVGFTAGAGTYTWQPAESGYYAVSLTVDVTNTSLTANVNGIGLWHSSNCSTFAHRPVKGYVNNAARYTASRVLGHSILVSNGTAVLDREGYAAATQSAVGYEWTNYIGLNFADFATNANVARRTFVKGAYAFATPSDETDFQFIESHEIVNYALMTSYFWLDLNMPVLTMVLKIDDTTNLNAIVYTSASLEMQSNDPWMDLYKPQSTNGEWQSAFALIKRMEFLYENDSHWNKIMNFVKGAVKAAPGVIRKYGPAIATGLEMLL